ncbi:helix-turn-helix domain-containing protein [Lichenicoccus sp.]|uniref:helix-turn-helix domain-containing protein n=1 Tax=Lichenicoccus sp. TaxID=2781899 RepID=UPI003D0EEFD4
MPSSSPALTLPGTTLPGTPAPSAETVLPALAVPELPAEPAPAAQTGLAIGSRIRILRRARGLTQDTLAMSTGVSRSAVAQWETGRAGQMGSKLRRIAEALGVSVSMLKEGWEGLATDSVLSSDEMSLLRLFRACSAEDRSVLMHVAQKLSSDPGAESDAEARRSA